MDIRPAIPPVVPVVMAVIRMPVIAVMPGVQVMRVPANGECGRNTPEVVIGKRIPGRIRVVVNGIRTRVIVVDRSWLIDNDTLRLVVRDVDHILLNRSYLDRAVFLGDRLEIVALEIACRICAVTKCLDRGDDIGLLGNDGLSETPGPVEVLTHHFDDLWIIRECDDRVIPVFIRLQRRVFFEVFQESRSLHDLQGIGRCRQDNCQQVIRVQGDRTDQFLEFRRRQSIKFLDLGAWYDLSLTNRLAAFIYRYLRVGRHGPAEKCRQNPERSNCSHSITHGASGFRRPSTDLPILSRRIAQIN
jgi:hypothetical protein